MRLTTNSCVTDHLKMLTYYRVCCAFSSAGALLFVVIHYFKDRYNLVYLALTVVASPVKSGAYYTGAAIRRRRIILVNRSIFLGIR